MALYLGWSERRIKLRVKANFGVIVDIHGSTPVMSLEVENVGFRTARITGFGWTTGFLSVGPRLPKFLRLHSGHQNPDYRWAINENFPWVLEPGQSKATHMRREAFIDAFMYPSDSGLFRELPFSQKPVLLRHRCYVGVATRSKIYFGKVDKRITKAITAAYRESIKKSQNYAETPA